MKCAAVFGKTITRTLDGNEVVLAVPRVDRSFKRRMAPSLVPEDLGRTLKKIWGCVLGKRLEPSEI